LEALECGVDAERRGGREEMRERIQVEISWIRCGLEGEVRMEWVRNDISSRIRAVLGVMSRWAALKRKVCWERMKGVLRFIRDREGLTGLSKGSKLDSKIGSVSFEHAK
jgi:hypothetical protein